MGRRWNHGSESLGHCGAGYLKRWALLLVLLSITAGSVSTGITPPLFFTFVPTNPPGSGCIGTAASYAGAGGFCSVLSATVENHLDGIIVRVSAQTVDTGDSNGGVLDMSNWSGADSGSGLYRFALFNGNGYNLTASSSCSTTAGVATCNAQTGITWLPPDGNVCIGGVSVSNYNGCWVLTGATYSGANLSTFTFNIAGSPATGNGGYISAGCANGGSPKLCKIAIIVQHHRGGASKNMPDYPFSQAWINLVVQPWQPSTPYVFHQSVTHGGHCYYVTNPIGTNGGGITSATDPGNFSISGGTSVDNTITWKDNGATNCLPQESLVGPGYAGGGNAPTSYAGGGAFYNVNSTVGAGVANCTPSTCVADDVGLGFPVFFETPYLTWINAFNAIPMDSFGNPSAVYHYAQVVWEPQLLYLRFGGMDNGEWNKFLAGTDQSASAGTATGAGWVTGGMTYAQFRGAYLDAYANSFFTNIVTAWKASGATYQLDSGTNCFAGGNGAGKCLDYSQDIVANAKAASLNYGFGNQGWWIQDPGVNAAGSCASAVTGCEWVTFPLYQAQDQALGNIRHIQLQAPTCPANGNAGHCTNPTEGSLAGFAQLATQHRVTVIEWFSSELSCTYDSRYTYANGVASGCEYADMQADNYQYFMNNLLKGLPSFTSASSGTSTLAGTSSIQ